MRIYFEVMGEGMAAADNVPYNMIPRGISYFPRELFVLPQSSVHMPKILSFSDWFFRWSRSVGNVVHEAVHEHGGHFAAYERPEDLVGDVRAMFGKSGPAHGVVPGKTGYA